MKKQQTGFTLIELMISLTLGLLVVAAGTSIFLSAQKSLNIQTTVGEVQQNSIFGLSSIARDIRHANLNLSNDIVGDMQRTTVRSGIVFSATNLPTGVNFANLATTNEQLTIQFAPILSNSASGMPAGFMTCSAEEVQPTADGKLVIIQRYFIDGGALSCRAYSYELDNAGQLVADSAHTYRVQQIMQNIADFRIRFGVIAGEASGVAQYQYKLPGSIVDTDKIVSVELGVLARSTNTAATGAAPASTTYTIAGQNVTPASANFLYQPVTQVVAFRNSAGVL